MEQPGKKNHLAEILSVVGSKWGFSILKTITDAKTINFNAIRKAYDNKISPNHLSSMLKKLIKLNLVVRERAEEKVFYKPTSTGVAVVKKLEEIQSLK